MSRRLAQVYRDALRPEAEGLAGAEPLEEALQAMLEAGRAAWPRLELPEAVFVEHVARVAPRGALGQLRAADLYLACACVRGEQQALAAFEQTQLPRLDKALAAAGLEPASIEEVKQRVREHVLMGKREQPPKIAGYGGQGSLASWLKAIAVREGLRRQRRGASQAAPRDVELIQRGALSPELAFIQDRHRTQVEEAFRAALALLSPRERNILRMFVIDGVSAERIGLFYRVHRSSAARWIADARQKLIDEIRRRLMDQLQLRRSEVESLIGLVRSRLDVSLGGFLREELDETP